MRPYRRFRSFSVLLTVPLLISLVSCSPPETPEPSPTASQSASPAPSSKEQPTLEDLAPGLLLAQTTFTQPATQLDNTGPAVTIDASAPAPTGQWSSQNIGLSFEATTLANPLWEPDAGYLDELLVALPGLGLRFGGNSVDRSTWWTSTGEPAPEWAKATVTPADFERLAETVAGSDAKVTLAVDLGHNDPARAADMVYHAHQALGDSLIGVTIGNEPNGFYLKSQPELELRDASWGPDAYVTEATTYVQAIHTRVPDIPITGPGAFDASWWRAFINADFPNTAALSQHWYPLWSCDGVKEPRAQPTIENITAPWLHDRASFIIGMGLDTASAAGLPLWMEETGPTSCAGSNPTSRSHAQALWTVDYSLHAAQLGVVRLNHHSMLGACEGGAPMSVLCERDDVMNGQANFLSLLFLAQLRPGSAIAPLSVQGDDKVIAYAISDATGLDVVVVNFNDPAAFGRTPVTITVPEGMELAEVSQLNGSGLEIRNDSTLIPLSRATEVPAEINPASTTLLRYTPAAGEDG